MKFDSTVFHILEKNKPEKKPKKKSKLDFTSDDINGDGKVNKTDGYLSKRNQAIKNNMAKPKNGK